MLQALKSKTVVLAIIQGIAGVVTAVIAQDPTLEAIGTGAVVKSILDVVLRYLTTHPVSDK